ncbi:hypothetical protein ACTXT7_001758 [Hymenolepis weldensis]
MGKVGSYELYENVRGKKCKVPVLLIIYYFNNEQDKGGRNATYQNVISNVKIEFSEQASSNNQ